MAPKLQPAALERLAYQLADPVAALFARDDRFPVHAEITDSFPVWLLGEDAIREPGGTTLAELARPNGQWHLQISVDGAVEAFARSFGPPDGEVTPCGVFPSAVATKLDELSRG